MWGVSSSGGRDDKRNDHCSHRAPGITGREVQAAEHMRQGPLSRSGGSSETWLQPCPTHPLFRWDLSSPVHRDQDGDISPESVPIRGCGNQAWGWRVALSPTSAGTQVGPVSPKGVVDVGRSQTCAQQTHSKFRESCKQASKQTKAF